MAAFGNSKFLQRALESRRALPAIGVFKLVKVALLVLTGLAAHKLLHTPDVEQGLVRFAERWRFDPTDERVQWVFTRIARISPRTLQTLQIGTFIYAGLYCVEGTGLLLGFAWAEWMTVITTAGLIPLEIIELIRRLTWLRGTLLVVNIAIVIYLILHLIHRRRRRRERTAGDAGPTGRPVISDVVLPH